MSLIFALLLWTGSTPQQTTVPTGAEARAAAYQARLDMEAQSPFSQLTYRSVGPHVMSGRITDLAAFPDHPYTLYVAYASGGLWRTDNNGTTWRPLFDRSASITIGAIAVDPKNIDRIWLASGEGNSSRSSYAGTGIYYSEDGGRSWTHQGLDETHHFGRLVIDPNDGNTLYAAAIGHLYSVDDARGLYKTTDGGKSWQKVLHVNAQTGIIDVAVDPFNPQRILAAAWERSRTAWNFEECGSGSGLYLSQDGGASWQHIKQGLPAGAHMGRIGVAFSPAQKDRVFLCVDNQLETQEPEEETRDLTKRQLQGMDKDALLALDDKKIDDFLRANAFHEEITPENLRKGLESGDTRIQDILDYMFDGNASLFDKPLIGVEVYRSDDGGASWQRTHEKDLPDFAWSYGYYFGQIRLHPQEADTLYVMAVPLLVSKDAGKTWSSLDAHNVHVDHHALWINPTAPQHVVLGNDGGLNVSWDGGAHWQKFNNLPVGQFYTLTYDMADDYRIYGGLQDNGTWRGSNQEWEPGAPAWEFINGGDGAFVQVDPRDNETVYSGYQFGHYLRQNMKTGDSQEIYPRHRLKQQPYRFNWMTPILLSHHHPDILYMGAQYVLRSMDQGKTWVEISPDLTTNPLQGDVPYGTITILRESTHDFGTLYAGTDDGRLWVQIKGGVWEERTQGLPQGLWVSSIEASSHQPATVFATLTGYRNDDFSTYVFMSEDYGKNWKSLQANLPAESCNVIRQDPENENILYLGTDLGCWVSFDQGNHWMPLQSQLPHVPVYAMEIHPREHELILATHGRSIFVLELNQLAEYDEALFRKDLFVFNIEDITFSEDWGNKPSWAWSKDEEPPTTEFWFHAKQAGTVELAILRDTSRLMETKVEAKAGMNLFRWDFSVEPPKPAKGVPRQGRVQDKENRAKEPVAYHPGENGSTYAVEGTYRFRVRQEEASFVKSFEIKADE